MLLLAFHRGIERKKKEEKDGKSFFVFLGWVMLAFEAVAVPVEVLWLNYLVGILVLRLACVAYG